MVGPVDTEIDWGVGSESLASAVLRAEAAVEHMRDVGALREAAQRLVDVAARVSCSDVVAATQAAEPLVTAATLVSDGSLRMMSQTRFAGERAILVDAATVTGSAVRACAASLRGQGATWVAAVIYARTRPDLDDLENDPAINLVSELGLDERVNPLQAPPR